MQAIRARLDPTDHDAVPALEIRRHAVEALRAILVAIASRRPVVLAIEDLQWADADSAALLAKLCDPPIPGLLVTASFRGDEEALDPAFGQYLDAVHVHTPFVQALRCFLGEAEAPGSLDGGSFTERAAIVTARASGSRSAELIVRLLMGMVRYHFGEPREASAIFEEARPFLDGVASTWHVPVFHQHAALAIAALPEAEREARRSAAEASLAALGAFAAHGPENFAHKVALCEGELARASGDAGAALVALRRAAEGAAAGGFSCDEGLAHELLARCLRAVGEAEEAARHVDAAREAYGRWGARAKVARLE